MAACRTDDTGSNDETSETGETGSDADYTWWRDVEPIVTQKCSCHRASDIAPFSLAEHSEFVALASILGPAIESGAMPPWPPDPGCNEYANPRALTLEQEEILLSYIAGEMPEGDPADAPPDEDPPPPFVPDLVLEMPEDYTPSSHPDDYRCFTIPWPEDISADSFVTGFDVVPSERSIVHHVILFVVPPAQVDTFVQLDEAEAGPGYTCFGGPGGPPGGVRWVGGWVPSLKPFVAPPGVGQRIEPGSLMIAQVHYNSAAGSTLADRTSIGLTLASSVERESVVLPLADIAWLAGNGAMSIPAGEANVTHEAYFTYDHPIVASLIGGLGLDPGAELEIANVGFHMHLFGKRGLLEVERADGSSECLVDIPEWDFHWQSSYDFVEPVRYGPDDELHLQCWWDNSASNQPIVDGQPLEPAERDWGEGTLDEMCLGILYVSAADG